MAALTRYDHRLAFYMNQSLASGPTDEILIARQPIYDSHLNVVAYELLYRDNHINQAVIGNHEIATSTVIVNAFVNIGFDTLVGDKKAFVNMPKGLLIGNEPFALPCENIVLEILEDVVVDKSVIAAAKKLVEKGYTIALDDFVFAEEWRPLVELASIIKIDLLAMDEQQLVSEVKFLKPFDVELLAEKVETKHEFELCQKLGFSYFQGYYFSRPQIVKGAKVPSSKLAVLRILSRIYDPDISFLELEEILSQDVALSYKLLRILNSAAFKNSKKIESLKQAITIMGLNNLRNWVSLLTFSGISNKPAELFKASIVRAKMCELLALQTKQIEDSNIYFMVGLFSNIDALLDQPLDILTAKMPFSDEVNVALLKHSGAMGSVLDCVINYEQGNWNNISENFCKASALRNIYFQALEWAVSIEKTM